MKPPSSRLEFIDGLKAVAMQIIVLHHLVSYGPLADAARTLAPDLVMWLYAHGRMAVQVFLVIGGYLAARALSRPGAVCSGSLAPVLLNRYLRLALPYSAALFLAVACAAFARRWMDDDDFISAAPTLAQWLAHVFLLQDLLGYESLSTGVWYVAIDFQLFALLAILLKLQPRTWMLAVWALCAASVFWFNRNEDFDNLAVYFFGAYGLGVMAYWAGTGRHRAALCQCLLWATMIIALLFDFRWRLLLALVTAIVLYVSCSGLLPRLHLPHRMAAMGRISYALFLVHFPLYMLISALFVKYGLLAGPWTGFAGIAATWLASIAAAMFLHRWIEMPAGRLKFTWAAVRQ